MPLSAANLGGPGGLIRLGRQNKLLTSAHFKAVFGQKKSLHGKFFSIHARHNELDRPRLGITVSKRVSKRAVQRNRIKRQIRESFRLFGADLSSYDYIVVAKMGGAEQLNKQLRAELDWMWPRILKKVRQEIQPDSGVRN